MKPDLDALNAIADVVLRYRPPGKGGAKAGKAVRESIFTYYEFFAGGGMARAGLGPRWRCLFANDFDHKKSATYRENWKGNALKTKDVAKIETSEIPGSASLAWASFPCQDLSLAGMGAGLKGDRSGTFWPFWRLIEQLRKEGRGPRLLVLENVCGTLTSHKGKDFNAIADTLAATGYSFGALVVDAVEFVPQSRQRLFIIAVDSDTPVPPSLTSQERDPRHHTNALCLAHSRLEGQARDKWVWWNLPPAPKRTFGLVDIVEQEPTGVDWHSSEETEKLLAMMSAINQKKVEEAMRDGVLRVGTVYKRTRIEEGRKVQRAEVRFDDVSGCLRTSTGGSSRQFMLIVHGHQVRSRLISIRETARLMGLPENYKLPSKYNEAYHLTGDGVVVPVVRHIAAKILEPILSASVIKRRRPA